MIDRSDELGPLDDGIFMIQVDEPSVESKLESHRISFEWARQNLPEAKT